MRKFVTFFFLTNLTETNHLGYALTLIITTVAGGNHLDCCIIRLS